jgi:hypothetical protein
MRVPAWAGPWAWADELERQARIMRCSTPHYTRFKATCRLLTPWRVRSPAQCSAAAIERILPLLEEMHARGALQRHHTHDARVPHDWPLGELLVEARNRRRLAELGRNQARIRNPRFALELIPDERLEALIQRHPNLELVEKMRAERARRSA